MKRLLLLSTLLMFTEKSFADDQLIEKHFCKIYCFMTNQGLTNFPYLGKVETDSFTDKESAFDMAEQLCYQRAKNYKFNYDSNYVFMSPSLKGISIRGTSKPGHRNSRINENSEVLIELNGDESTIENSCITKLVPDEPCPHPYHNGRHSRG